MCLSCSPDQLDLGDTITSADVLHDAPVRPTPPGQYRPTWQDVATILQVRVMLERAGCPAGPITAHADGVLVLEQMPDPAATVERLKHDGWTATLEHGNPSTVWACRQQ